tara:strand:+ start:587 stop:877 length:291 start_codon:yes stop_codon:yes gene_type:complete
MVVKLVEIAETYDVGATKKYVLREVFVNPEHVICLRPDELAKRKLNENKLPPNLDKRQEFTTVQMNSGHNGFTITVIGDPSSVEQKLRRNVKVIRG